MNKVYKVIYNRTRHVYQVVSELIKGKGKNKSIKMNVSRGGTALD